MNIKEILGYHADNHRSYQTGEGTEAPIFIYADADYEVGDGKCGLHEIVRNANEPAIVYVRADSFLSRNEWLQERIDILATANSWKARAEAAEAKVAMAQNLLKRVPMAINSAFAAGTEEREGGSARRQAKAMAGPEILKQEIRAALAAMEATDE